MPLYLVTDNVTGDRALVEAARPAGALTALYGRRFIVAGALEAAEAVRISRQPDVMFVEAGEQDEALADDAPLLVPVEDGMADDQPASANGVPVLDDELSEVRF